MLQAGHRTGRRACAAGTAAQCPWAQAGACEAGPSRSDSAGAVPAARGHKCPPLPSGTVRIEEDSRTDSISRLLYGRPINLTPSTPARRRRAPARRPTAEAARSARCWRDLAARFEGRRPLSVDNGNPTSALPPRVRPLLSSSPDRATCRCEDAGAHLFGDGRQLVASRRSRAVVALMSGRTLQSPRSAVAKRPCPSSNARRGRAPAPHQSG